MTRSTGKMERQRRREELLGAELALCGVLRHLQESASWARRLADQAEFDAIRESYTRVKLRLLDVRDEQKALG